MKPMSIAGTADGSPAANRGLASVVACGLAAAAAYLCIALFLLRGVLADPTRLLPFNGQINESSALLGHMDQSMVVAVITRNADTLFHAPATLRDAPGACHPLPGAWVLGEHMFGEGLLMALPWALTGDPVLAYNVLLLLTLWIPGLTAFALGMRFLRSPPAAFVSGLLFQLVPARVIDGGHPYLHGDLWLPLALLALHDVCRRARWRDGLLLGVTTALCALETIYVLLAALLQLGVYALHLARGVPRPGRSLALLAAAGALSGAVALWVLGPYFEARAEWGLLAGRRTFFVPWWVYLPGYITFPGFGLLALVGLGLLDRRRGAREIEGDDPRLALLAGTGFVLWCTTTGLPLPGFGTEIPSPFRLLAGILPGLDAVRSLYAMGNAAWIGACLVAGYGVLQLGRMAGGRTVLAGVVAGFVVLAVQLEPRLARFAFGAPLDFRVWQAAPSSDEIELVRASGPEGAIVDLPMPAPGQGMARLGMARQMLLAAYGPRPTAACYNSFETPLADQMWQLTTALPAPGAVAALGALGFDTALSHGALWSPPKRQRFEAEVAAGPPGTARLVATGTAGDVTAYRLETAGAGTGSSAWTDDVAVLAPAGEPELSVPTAGGSLRLAVRVTGDVAYRAERIAPAAVMLRWREDQGTVAGESRARTLLPIALGPGLTSEITVWAVPPRAGHFLLELEPVSHPGAIVARARVNAVAANVEQ